MAVPADKTLNWPRQAKRRNRNPQRVWAHMALRSGLRRGLIDKQPCHVCGHPNTEGHHEDYSKPLEVTWLCRRHHREAHSLTSREKGGA